MTDKYPSCDKTLEARSAEEDAEGCTQRITIDRIDYRDVHIQPRRVFALPVKRMGRQYLYVDYDALNIYASADTFDELVIAVAEDIYVLWREYALERDEVLSPAAKNLKRILLEMFEVIND